MVPDSLVFESLLCYYFDLSAWVNNKMAELKFSPSSLNGDDFGTDLIIQVMMGIH